MGNPGYLLLGPLVERLDQGYQLFFGRLVLVGEPKNPKKLVKGHLAGGPR